jgi:hypothetical protein
LAQTITVWAFFILLEQLDGILDMPQNFVSARIKDCGRLSRKEQAPASVATGACL